MNTIREHFKEDLDVLRDFLDSDIAQTFKDEASERRVMRRLKDAPFEPAETVFDLMVDTIGTLEMTNMGLLDKINVLEHNQRIILKALKSLNEQPKLDQIAESDLITVCNNNAIY